jgi:tetratricopeptide (TPR) repeat protein
MKRLPIFVLLAALFAACSESTATSPNDVQERALGMLAAGDGAGLSAFLKSSEADVLSDSVRVDLEAQLAAAADDVPKAVRLCVAHLEAHPGDERVAYTLTDIYLNLGAGDLARAHIDKTLAANPAACKMHYYSGVLHGAKGRLDQAAAEFEQAVACGYTSPDLQYNLAVLDQSQGRTDQSIERLRRLRAEQPEWRNVRRELARGLIAKGDPESMDEAQVLLDELSVVIESEIVIDEEHDGVGQGDWRVWELLGLHAEQQGDLPAAQAYFVEALKAGKNPPQVEDHYRRVSEGLIEAGMQEMVPVREGNKDLPPISAGMQERFDEAKRKKQHAEAEAGPEPDSDQR